MSVQNWFVVVLVTLRPPLKRRRFRQTRLTSLWNKDRVMSVPVEACLFPVILFASAPRQRS